MNPYDRVARNQFNYRVSLLRSFFAFWKERGSPWPIRASVALDWVAVGADCQRPYRDLRRLQVVQAFLQQVRVFEPATEIPENVFRTSVGRRTPHIFTDQEVERLMEAARQHRNCHTLYPLTLYTLIGLLASTGLRIGETISPESGGCAIVCGSTASVDLRDQVLQIAKGCAAPLYGRTVAAIPRSKSSGVAS